MRVRPAPAYDSSSRIDRVTGWIAAVGFAFVLGVTTLGLGGLPAETMVFSGTALLIVGAVSLAGWALGQRIASQGIHWGALLPIPILVYGLVSIRWLTPTPWLAWREWLLWFDAWIVLCVFLHVARTRRQTWFLILTCLVLGLVNVYLAAFQRLSDPTWLMLGRLQVPQFRGRSSGSFGIPNSLAAFLGLMIPAGLTLLTSRAVRPWIKVLCAWTAGLFLLGSILTGSRGGWLALGISLLAWPLMGARGWQRKLVGVLVVAVFVGGGLFSVFHGSKYARERLLPLLEGQAEPSRPVLWSAGQALWHEAPWLGTGLGSYQFLFERHRPEKFPTAPVWTHNDYLNLLSDSGLLGFLFGVGAAVGFAVLGWAAVQDARRSPSGGVAQLAKFKLGLWLGLLGFALHLLTEFHLKIPALCLMAALLLALLLRDDPRWSWRPPRPVLRGLAIVAGGGALVIAWRVALPVYRAEALRADARGEIDRYARTHEGDLGQLVEKSRRALAQAVAIDPANAQAWSDLAYLTGLTAGSRPADRAGLGRFAELAADRALALCPVAWEFWLRKATALELQDDSPEAEKCFQQAIELAPNLPEPRLLYARFLARWPERRVDAVRSLATCLTLDPFYPGSDILRQKLAETR